MKTRAAPDPERLHVAIAMLRLWLADLCVWLAAWLGVKLPRDLRMELRRDLARTLSQARLVVFLLAFARLKLPALPPATARPLSAPAGCRRARAGGEGRVFRRGLRLEGRTLAARFAALRAVFADLGRAVARMLRHLRRRAPAAAIVLVGAIAERLCGARAAAPAAMDSS